MVDRTDERCPNCGHEAHGATADGMYDDESICGEEIGDTGDGICLCDDRDFTIAAQAATIEQQAREIERLKSRQCEFCHMTFDPVRLRTDARLGAGLRELIAEEGQCIVQRAVALPSYIEPRGLSNPFIICETRSLQETHGNPTHRWEADTLDAAISQAVEQARKVSK